MVVFKNVSCSYEKGKKVLDNISFRIEEGESVGLIGANGAGKSMLMKVLLGLLPAEGDVTADGIRLEKKTLADIRKKIGFVLQDSEQQLFMPTVREDILFGPMNYGLSLKEAEEKSDEALKVLGMEYLKDRYNHKLSGGEKRMAAIAVILAMEPKIIVMDEPSASLDPVNRRMVIRAVQALP
ncbi:MAG: ABC transporter ATP-binding protein, partial [Parasporobacterium sp.]|nr:ABC transporter ATP-binding protein [Parasporobacterium sp.]